MFTCTLRILALLPFCLGVSSSTPATGVTPDEGSTADRLGLRAAFEASRHAVRSVAGGFEMRNPGQRWSTRFETRGFLTTPDSGNWSWGLELESYGFADNPRFVEGHRHVRAEGNRLVSTRDAILQEWWINDRRGLEHGYTVHQRPARVDESEPSSLIHSESVSARRAQKTGREGIESLENRDPNGRLTASIGGRQPALTFTLVVRGTLHPEVSPGERDVRFLGEDGRTVLTYSGLCVFDADGRELDARFERRSDRLRLEIDERDARYPLTIDPIAQQAYLKASNTGMSDYFGYAVAISGDTAVVGAPEESSSATGVGGNETDDSATRAGAVYVFARTGGTWRQQAYLKASNNGPADTFGASVAISGDTVVVGSPREQSTAPYSGAAYVFVRDGTTSTEQALLKASNANDYDYFGTAVAVSGDRVVVGAPGENCSSTGVDGDQTTYDAYDSGATYLFVRSGESWSQEAYLKASNTEAGDEFGSAVAIYDETVVVTAIQEDSADTGVDGSQTSNGSPGSGAAYVFARNGPTWEQQAFLKASNTETTDGFGHSVTVWDRTIAVGAIREDSAAAGVDGDASDNSALSAGAVYVFRWNGSSWNHEAYLKASNTDPGDRFGYSVSTEDDLLVVGAPCEESAAVGIGGDQTDNSTWWAGAAYLFEREAGTWIQFAYVKPSNTTQEMRFGFSAALSGDTVLLGAPEEDSGATGVNGDQNNGDAPNSGAVYVIDLDDITGYSYCYGDFVDGTACPCQNDNDVSIPGSGCANGSFWSGAHLSVSGTPSKQNDTLVLSTIHLEPNQFGIYFQGDTKISPGTPWGDGVRCVDGDLKRLQVVFSDAAGSSFTTIAISAEAGNITAGNTKYYQCVYRDTTDPQCGAGVNDFNTSNGYAVTWGP